MNVIGANGLDGDVSTPISMPMRWFSQATVLHRSMSGMIVQNVTFVENGNMTFSAEAIASPKTNNIIGTFTAPIAYCYGKAYTEVDKGPSVQQRVSKVLEKVNELYFDKFQVANGFDANGEKAKVIDVMIETVPRVGRNSFLMYIDRHDLVIEMDERFKALQDDALQDFITTQLMGIKQIPVPKIIGYGLLRGDNGKKGTWAQMTRPNTYMKVAPRTVLKASKVANDFLKTEWQVQTFYMHILAEALKRWIGDVIPAYTLDDWVAFANLLVGAFAGYGSTERDQKWLATDIETSINTVPGFGWTKANRFLWGNVNTEEDFKYYYCIMNLLGFVIQRTKAAMMDFAVKTVISTNDWQVPMRFKRALEPNIAGWGSNGTFFYLMPRNNFSYGEVNDVPMPCIVDDVRFEDQADIIKKANNYEDLLPYKQQSWGDVTIDRGEVPQGTIRSDSKETQFLRLHATTDARIVSFQDTKTEYVRRLLQYRFPMDHIVNNGLVREDRMRLWLWGLLANGEKGMSNAFIIESSLGVFTPQVVNYRRGPLDSQLIDKEGTQTVGDQVLKPGTIPTVPNTSGATNVKQTITPPPPQPKPRFSEKTIELKTGEEVKEEAATDSSNVNAETTNNQPEET